MALAAKMKCIDLLLIGKTGNGKSATGNTILGHKAFNSSFSMNSVTLNAQAEVTEYNGRRIRVVDTPGVGDTRMDTEGGQNLVMNAMQQAIALNPIGYHAFLLVVKFGGRFTQEDVDTIRFLKLIFGQDFAKKYCILIMTHGDMFERACEDEPGLTFEKWCEQETGFFKQLLDECEHRVLLFENGSKDPAKQNAQLDNLIEVMDTLWLPGHRYTDENFKMAQEMREKYLVESKEPMIREEMMTEMSLILQNLEKVQKLDPVHQMKPLKELSEKAVALCKEIKTRDNKTGALKRLKKEAKSIKKTIEDEIRFCTRFPQIKQAMETDQGHQEAEQIKAQQEAAIRELRGGYYALRQEYDKGIAEKAVDVVSWPLRAVAKGLDWVGGQVVSWFSDK